MTKIFILLGIFFLISTDAYADECPAPTNNPPRTVEATLKLVQDYIVEKYEELSEKAEKQKKESKFGNQNCANSPQNTKDNAIKIEVYEYLLDKVIGQSDDTHTYLTPSKDFTEARKEVKEKLFQPAPPRLTKSGEWVSDHLGVNAQSFDKAGKTIDQIETLLRRDDYANAVASKNLEIATQLRSKVLEDIASTQKAETTGCNQLQGLVLENRNLGALVAETAADITIQILTLESMAARNLQKEAVSLVPLPRVPDKDNSATGSAIKASSASNP